MLTKKGFTLAEILLVLGILGVLAMLLIPVVKTVIPSENKVMFRKAYSSLEKAISLMINDEDHYPSDVVDTSSTMIKLGFNYITKTVNTDTNKFCYYLADQMSLIAGNTCPSYNTAGVTQFAITSDGMYWYIYLPPGCGTASVDFPLTQTSSSYPTKIIVDINGANPPNCFSDPNYATYKPSNDYTSCATNPDTFIIGVRYDGKLIVGVLAAILTPTIVNVSPSSNKVMFKKEHALLEKTIANMISDGTNYPAGTTGLTSDGSSAYVQQGFSNTTIVTSGEGAMAIPAGVNKFCYLLGDGLDTLGTLDNKSCPPTNNGTFTTSDGAVWTIFYSGVQFPLAYNDFSKKIVIDVNGTKGPNCFTDTGYASYTSVLNSLTSKTYTTCTKNPDTFVIGVRYDGKLQVGSGVDASGNSKDANAVNILKSSTVNTPDN